MAYLSLSGNPNKPYVNVDRTDEEQEAHLAKMQEAYDAGLKGDVAFCAKEKLGWDVNHLSALMEGAAQGGHENLCQLAKELGSTDFAGMANNAAKIHRKDLCLLALEWTEEAGLDEGCGANYDDVLYGAAAAGHEDLCRFAKDNGATSFDCMLWDGLRSGGSKICNLAVEWGATCFVDSFIHAVESGSATSCVYVKDVLKQTNFDVMKRAAEELGEAHLVALADEWAGQA